MPDDSVLRAASLACSHLVAKAGVVASDPGFASVLDYYTNLFAEGDDGMLGYAVCVTVLPGWHDQSEVLRRLGTVVRRAELVSAADFSQADLDTTLESGWVAVTWLARLDDAIVLIEESGIELALPELLGPLSADGHRVVNASFKRSYPGASVATAEDGLVQERSLTAYEQRGAAPALDPFLVDVDPDDWDSHPVVAFTIAEMLSGVRLDLSVFEGPWPAAWFRPVRDRS